MLNRVLTRTGIVDREPLLMETKRRFVLFPIQYPEASLSMWRIQHSYPC